MSFHLFNCKFIVLFLFYSTKICENTAKNDRAQKGRIAGISKTQVYTNSKSGIGSSCALQDARIFSLAMYCDENDWKYDQDPIFWGQYNAQHKYEKLFGFLRIK